LVAISTNGEIQWHYQAAVGYTFSATLVSERRVYVIAPRQRQIHIDRREPGGYDEDVGAGAVVALAVDGRELWNVEIDDEPYSEPVVMANGAVYTLGIYTEITQKEVRTDTAYLINLSPDGEVNWRCLLRGAELRWTEGKFNALTLLRDGTVGFGGWKHIFHTYSADAIQRWTKEFQSCPDTHAAISPDGTVVLLSNYMPELHDKQLALMSWEVMNTFGVVQTVTSQGAKYWNLQVASDIHSAPAICQDGWIYFGGTNYTHDRPSEAQAHGTVYALDGDGRLQYTFDTRKEFADHPLQPEPLVDSAGVLYIADSGKHLYAISKSGELLAESSTPGGYATNAVIDGQGRLYIGAAGGVLHALGD
jgi:hypothetical protein